MFLKTIATILISLIVFVGWSFTVNQYQGITEMPTVAEMISAGIWPGTWKFLMQPTVAGAFLATAAVIFGVGGTR